MLDSIRGSITLVDEGSALRAAKESEARWKDGRPIGVLDGVPFTANDNLMVRGYPFRRGSLVTPPKAVGEDASIVRRSREAGGVFLGLNTMPEFGVGHVTISPLSGITRNPWDMIRQSGGSSGGAAAGSRLTFPIFALGSDAGGSIRIPAALTGVVGLKPSRACPCILQALRACCRATGTVNLSERWAEESRFF